MLYFHFKNLTESFIVMLSLPFALVGGVWLMFFSGYNMSVVVVVRFIAFADLAVETGMVMLVYLDEAFARFKADGRMNSWKDLKQAISKGAVERVHPKLMTVATKLIGLLPVMIGSATGSQVMKRIATPMVSGLINLTILTLIIIPAIYVLWKRFALRRVFAQRGEY